MIDQINEIDGVEVQAVDDVEISRDMSHVFSDPSFTSADMPSFLKPNDYARTMSIHEMLEQSKTCDIRL